MNTAPAIADRVAWLARRRSRIGASDVAAIVGLSPWRSAVALWLDKVGLLADDDEDDAPAHLRLGRDLEPIIARWFHRETGLDVAGEQMELTVAGEPWAGCTIDGLVLENLASSCECSIDDALGIFEAKYVAGPPWAEVPAHYLAQLQWAMWVSGLGRAWLACLHLPFGRPRFKVYEVERDPADIELLSTRARAFWYDHVLAGVMPPIDGSEATARALGAAWPDPTTIPAVDVAELRDVIHELGVFKATRKLLDADIKAHENRIKAMLGSQTEGVIDGELVCSWRPQGRTDIDAAAVRAEFGTRFDRRSEYRVLRLHERKSA